jgi:hypothetical protein
MTLRFNPGEPVLCVQRYSALVIDSRFQTERLGFGRKRTRFFVRALCVK